MLKLIFIMSNLISFIFKFLWQWSEVLWDFNPLLTILQRVSITERIAGDTKFKKPFFTGDVTFHVSGIETITITEFGTHRPPHKFLGHIQASPQINVWCGVMHSHVLLEHSIFDHLETMILHHYIFLFCGHFKNS